MKKENLPALPQCLAHNTDSANMQGMEGTKERRNRGKERVPIPTLPTVPHSPAQTESCEQIGFSGKGRCRESGR